MNAPTATPGGRNVTAQAGLPGWRRWLAAIGLVLVLASLLPPLSVLARRYVFAESIQFSVFAMAGPALIVLGAPWRLLRLSGPADGWRPRTGATGRSCGPGSACSPSLACAWPGGCRQ